MTLETILSSLQSKLKPIGIYKLNGNTLVNAELSAYAQGLKILNDKLETLENESFIVTASDYGLSFRETLFGRVKSNRTVEERRDMLIYRGSINSNDFTRESIERALIAIGIKGAVSENVDGNNVYINCLDILDSFSSESDIIQRAQEFLPAHLNEIFDFRVLSWNYIDSKDISFDNMDSYERTWSFIDNFEE